MKYEERVDIGERWSKPHVSTTSLHGLRLFRDALVKNECCVGLDQSLLDGKFQVAGDNNNFNNSTNKMRSSMKKIWGWGQAP